MNLQPFSSSNKKFFSTLGRFATVGLISSTLIGCGGAEKASSPDGGGDVSMCANIHVGTQDQVINTAVGGAVVRELKFSKTPAKDENIRI